MARPNPAPFDILSLKCPGRSAFSRLSAFVFRAPCLVFSRHSRKYPQKFFFRIFTNITWHVIIRPIKYTIYCILNELAFGQKVGAVYDPFHQQAAACARASGSGAAGIVFEGKGSSTSGAALRRGLGVGRGTVQSAFQELKDWGRSSSTPAARAARFWSKVDRRKFFDACGYGELICLMPLDVNRDYRGLATGIYEIHFRKRASLSHPVCPWFAQP